MNSDFAWLEFTKTGKVEDYINYTKTRDENTFLNILNKDSLSANNGGDNGCR